MVTHESGGTLMARLKTGEINYHWQYLLKRFLLEAGTVGRKQGEITKKFANVLPDEVIMELEALWAEEKVQRFTTPTHGPKLVIWRATESLNV